MSEGLLCSAKGCQGTPGLEGSLPRYATQRPVLHVRAFVGETGMEAEPDVPVCDEHTAGIVADDFISDEGWDILRHAYRATHDGAEPLRSLTSLTWQPVGASAIFDRPVPGTEA